MQENLRFHGEFLRNLKRGSLLGNEEPEIGGDSPFFEIEY